jgi:hypothetical protein
MRYIISESKLEKSIYDYIDSMYDVNELNWVHPYEYDDETGYEGESDSVIDFYVGDYEGPWDSDFKFRWIDTDYYDEEDVESRAKTPLLEVHENEGEVLNSYFGDLWKGPMKKWFEKKLGFYNIKTIKVGISG